MQVPPMRYEVFGNRRSGFRNESLIFVRLTDEFDTLVAEDTKPRGVGPETWQTRGDVQG